jgi:hypothetical protein
MAEVDNIYKKLEEIGKKVVQEMRDIIQEGYGGRPAVASGNLMRSIDYDVQVQNGVWTLVIEYADYGKFVNNGRSPGKFPPKASIEAWVKLKGLPISAVWPIMVKIKKGGFYSKKMGTIRMGDKSTSVYTPIKGLHFTDPLAKNLDLQSLSKNLGVAFKDLIQDEIDKIKKEIETK